MKELKKILYCYLCYPEFSLIYIIFLTELESFFRTDFPPPGMLVNCLADGVQVDINIGSGFNGVMYVKGYSKNEECRRGMKSDVDTGTIDFKVKFNTCGLVHENVSLL